MCCGFLGLLCSCSFPFSFLLFDVLVPSFQQLISLNFKHFNLYFNFIFITELI